MPDEKGRPIFRVSPPGAPGNVDDCLEEIYAALVRHGYALTQARYGTQTMMVLSAQQGGPGSFRLEPAVQIASMVPGPKMDPRCGIIMRRVKGVSGIEVTQ